MFKKPKFKRPGKRGYAGTREGDVEPDLEQEKADERVFTR